MIDEIIEKLKVTHILDFGCGDGSFDYNKFPSLSITAIDKRTPEKAREFPANVKFINIYENNNETLLPLNDNHFDLVVMNWVLEHVTNPSFLITEAERVLKNGGYFYVTIPDYKSLQDRLFRLATTNVGSKLGPHIQKFTFQNFLELIYSTTNFKLEKFVVTEAGFAFMKHSILEVFHKPCMGFMNFFKKIGVNLLANSDYIFIFMLYPINYVKE